MCVLHVRSLNDSFSEFLKHTSLPVYRSYEKGQTASLRKGTVYDNFGFSCEVSKCEWSDFPGQVEEAIRFLKAHSEQLRSLTLNHKIDDIRLDFPIANRLSESVFCQCDFLPPELVSLCAQNCIGIELSHYDMGRGEENCEPSAPADREDTAAEL